jgi:hypothetical protein
MFNPQSIAGDRAPGRGQPFPKRLRPVSFIDMASQQRRMKARKPALTGRARSFSAGLSNQTGFAAAATIRAP